MNILAMNPVNVAKAPAPATMRTHAIIRPSVVKGYLSPYPTVVIVTKAHQKASSAFLIFDSGKSSKFITAIAANTIMQKEMAATAANEVPFR